MTKKELVKAISDLLGLPQQQVKQIVQKLLESVIETLAEEGRVELRKFGVFEVKTRKPRNARNPKTGEKVPIPARSVVTFKPGKEMEARVMEVIARKVRFAQLAETAEPGPSNRPAAKSRPVAAAQTTQADSEKPLPPTTPPPRPPQTPLDSP
jgi:integration host factor subunit beta